MPKRPSHHAGKANFVLYRPLRGKQPNECRQGPIGVPLSGIREDGDGVEAADVIRFFRSQGSFDSSSEPGGVYRQDVPRVNEPERTHVGIATRCFALVISAMDGSLVDTLCRGFLCEISLAYES